VLQCELTWLHTSLFHVSFVLTHETIAQEFSLKGLWDAVPLVATFVVSVSFLGVCLAIGIFKCAPHPDPHANSALPLEQPAHAADLRCMCPLTVRLMWSTSESCTLIAAPASQAGCPGRVPGRPMPE